MKVYFYDGTGAVIETVKVRKNVDASRLVVAEDVPAYTPKNGFYGKLFVEDGKLVWHYITVDPERELSGEEIMQMFEEVM